MQHAVGAVAMQQRKANLQMDDKGRRRRVLALLLRGLRLGVEDGLAAHASRRRAGEIKQQRPRGPGRYTIYHDIVEVIV